MDKTDEVGMGYHGWYEIQQPNMKKQHHSGEALLDCHADVLSGGWLM
jgi:hypothetical protein